MFLAALPFVVAAGALAGSNDGRLPGPARHLLFAYLTVVVGAYFVWSWRSGQTLAMKAWRLRVTDAAGRDLGAARALARYVAAAALVVPGLIGGLWLREHHEAVWAWIAVAPAALGIAWPLWDRDKRALYDVIAGTRLLRIL